MEFERGLSIWKREMFRKIYHIWGYKSESFFSEYVALSTIFVSLHWLLSEQNLEVKDFVDCGWLECSIDIKFWEGVYYEI